MSLLDRALAAAGADPGQFRALFGAFLKLDFRRARPGGGALRQKEMSMRARMAVSFGITLVLSLAVGAASRATADRMTYAALVFGYALTMLGMMTLMELGVSLVQSEDSGLLGARPLSDATYTWAKVANLAVFVAFYGVAVSLVPVVMGLFCKGGGLAFSACLATGLAVGAAAVAGLLLAGYGLLSRRADTERTRDLVNWLTIAFSVAVPVGYMLIHRWMDRTRGLSLPLGRHAWLAWLPPVWAAGAVEALLGSRDPLSLRLAASSVAALLAAAAAWAAVGRIGLFRLVAPSSPPRRERAVPRAGRLAWLRPWFSTPASWGVFRLLLAYLRRDRGTQARILPQFGVSAAFLAVSALQDLGDPWAGEPSSFMTFFVACHAAMTCAWVPLLLRFSEQWEASWIFAAAPGATLADLSRGLQRATLLLLMAPCFAAVWLYFALRWGSGLHALLHALPPFLGSVALMDVALIWRRPVPLSCRYVKGEAGTRMAITFTLMGGFALLWVLQQSLAGSLALTGLLILAELAGLFAMDRILAERLSRRSVVLADL